MQVTPHQEGGGFFGWLDRAGSALGEYAGRAVDIVAEAELMDLARSYGAETTVDTTGDPEAGAGNVDPDANKSFIEKNAGLLIVGAGLVLAAFVLAKAR